MNRLLFAGALAAAFPIGAMAHKASDSYLSLSVDGATVAGRWDIALRDLDFAIGLDTNGDGAITWGEVRARETAILEYASHGFRISDGTALCPALLATPQIVEHSDGNYAALAMTARCPRPPRALTLSYDLLFEVDALHRGLLRLSWNGEHSAVFSPDRRALVFSSSDANPWRAFTQYLREGLLHVWTGYDHMLFLAGLFLPAVLRRKRGGGWIAEERLAPVFWATAKMVTAFTIAHALTLTLAATGALTLPSRLVESLVAATVAFAGLNNLVPMFHRSLFWLAGIFGLIHGAAIASALLDLGLPAANRVAALLGFNLGVEAAQLSLVAAVIPITFYARNAPWYRRAVLLPGALAVTVIGLLWLGERALNFKFLPF